MSRTLRASTARGALRVLLTAVAIAALASPAVFGGQQTEPPSRPESLFPALPDQSERTYEVFLQGRKAGWARETFTRRTGAGGVETATLASELLIRAVFTARVDLKLRIGPFSGRAPQQYRIEFEQRIRSRAVYDAKGLVSSEFVETEKDEEIKRVKVVRTPGGFEVTRADEGLARTVELGPGDFEATSDVLYQRPGLWSKVGDARLLSVLDLSTGAVIRRSYRVAALEELEVSGSKVACRVIDAVDPEGSFRLWVDQSGMEVRGLQKEEDVELIIHQADKKKALAFQPPEFDLAPSAKPEEGI